MTAHSGSPFSPTATPFVEKAPPVQGTHKAGCNLRTGRQLRAARALAGLTQKTLGAALGVDQRMIRFMERRQHSMPTRRKYHARIEQVLLAHGVRLVSEPAPGVILAN